MRRRNASGLDDLAFGLPGVGGAPGRVYVIFGGEALRSATSITLADPLTVPGAVLSHGEKVWATHTAYGPGDPLTVSQAFDDALFLYVDFADEAVATTIAEPPSKRNAVRRVIEFMWVHPLSLA